MAFSCYLTSATSPLLMMGHRPSAEALGLLLKYRSGLKGVRMQDITFYPFMGTEGSLTFGRADQKNKKNL